MTRTDHGAHRDPISSAWRVGIPKSAVPSTARPLLAGRIISVMAGACWFCMAWAGLRPIHHHHRNSAIHNHSQAPLAKCGSTPPVAGWFFGNNFRSALFTCSKRRVCLQTNHTKPPPAGFGGAMRRSRAITKKNMPFCALFFHVPK